MELSIKLGKSSQHKMDANNGNLTLVNVYCKRYTDVWLSSNSFLPVSALMVVLLLVLTNHVDAI